MSKRRFEVEVPDGQRLGVAQDVDGGYRGLLFDDETNELVGHAQLFEVSSTGDGPVEYVYLSNDGEQRDEDDELAELLGALIALAIIGAAHAAPHVRRFWVDRARPAIAARWRRMVRRNRPASRPVTVELVSLTEFAPSAPSKDPSVALDELRTSMSRSEARTRFAAALIARDFYEEQMRLLHNAEIHDDPAVSELGNRIKALAPEDVLHVLEDALADNPTVLDPITLKEFNARLDSGQLSLEMPREQRPQVSEPLLDNIE